jgi:hypothetical protein
MRIISRFASDAKTNIVSLFKLTVRQWKNLLKVCLNFVRFKFWSSEQHIRVGGGAVTAAGVIKYLPGAGAA